MSSITRFLSRKMKLPWRGELPRQERKPLSFYLGNSKTTSTEFDQAEDWGEFLNRLRESGIISDKEVCELILGAINPPQAGSRLACDVEIKSQYPPKEAWKNILPWMESLDGKCHSCGTRLNLEFDHIVPRKAGGPHALGNIQLSCRRCNSSRQHAKGGRLELTTQAALVYVYLSERPKTYSEYLKGCRSYGITASNIRVQEAWALQSWGLPFLAERGKMGSAKQTEATSRRKQ